MNTQQEMKDKEEEETCLSRSSVLSVLLGEEFPSFTSPASPLEFMVTSWHSQDEEKDDDEGEEEEGEEGGRGASFVIRAFGVTREGRSVCLVIDGFPPYFYVKVPGLAREGTASGNLSKIENFLKDRFKGTCDGVQHMKKKDFWGFTNGEMFDFFRLKFRSHVGMKKAASALGYPVIVPGIPGKVTLKTYESNIDPLLRFLHYRNVPSVGWLRVGRFIRLGKESSPCQIAASCDWKSVDPAPDLEKYQAPLLVAGFDIECDSAHGDFPVANKDYRKLAIDLVNAFERAGIRTLSEHEAKNRLVDCMFDAFSLPSSSSSSSSPPLVSNLQLKRPPSTRKEIDGLTKDIRNVVEDVYCALKHPTVKANGRPVVAPISDADDGEVEGEGGEDTSIVGILTTVFRKVFQKRWPLHGDAVIQIGVTLGLHGAPPSAPNVHRLAKGACPVRHIFTLRSCDPIEGTDGDRVFVRSFEREEDLLLAFVDLVRDVDPDVLLGYNIFGFDMSYMYDRAIELLGPERTMDRFCRFGRIERFPSKYVEQRLSSSALGDNVLKYLDMHGRIVIDLMKVVQREHRLDSYKLDAVAEHFIGLHKNDVSPNDVFRLQKGTSADRKVIAEYCLQDCALCNQIAAKLQILTNNSGMANVCRVPLSFIFMRGQGVKIFSLVAHRCREDGFLIPVVKRYSDGDADDQDGYEGAIVLEPETGMYLETPVSVLDYNSLYPSSMISHNLSQDSLVIDKKYDNLPGVEYVDVPYDLYEGTGDDKRVIGKQVCRWAQKSEGAVLPRILKDLLAQRKATRKKIETEKDPFVKAVLDGLQLAYKVTANSLYGQMGAKTSPLYLKHIAACTTAVGRNMILTAKDYVEGPECGGKVVYGDTDSIFVVFKNVDQESGEPLKGRDALASSIKQGQSASKGIKPLLPVPHNLEYEKTMFPLILLSKKRYVGLLYEDDPDAKPKQKSMGIALKRRDYAPIVKQIYGGIIDIILQDRDIPKAVDFLRTKLKDLVEGRYELTDLIISKTLRSYYKMPYQIPHWVLAKRMHERDPGSAPQSNDRVPYVFVETSKKNALMGDRIEHVDYVAKSLEKQRESRDRDSRYDVHVDTKLYIQNQIQKPCCQLLAIEIEKLPGYHPRRELSYGNGLSDLVKEKNGNARKARERFDTLREKEVERLLFDPVLSLPEIRDRDNRCNGQMDLHSFSFSAGVSSVPPPKAPNNAKITEKKKRDDALTNVRKIDSYYNRK